MHEACRILAVHVQGEGLYGSKALVSKVESAKALALLPFLKAVNEAEANLLLSGEKVGKAGLSSVAVTIRSARYAEAKAKHEEAVQDYRLARMVVDYTLSSWPYASFALANPR
jgi:hypothetical protein